MKNIYTQKTGVFAFFCLFALFSFKVFAQVGIGTTNPNANAKLDITSTVAEPGGLLIPRVALTGTANVAPLAAHVAGMTVYNTATVGNVTPGYYYSDGGQWVRIAAASVPSNDWTISGNAATTPGTGVGQNYLGTTDAQALVVATQATQRMRLLANGQIIVNNAAAPIAGDRFTVQGAADEDAINGYATGPAGVGVYGESAGFDAVVGNGARYGVVGLGTIGAYGSGTTFGNYGTVDNATGMGVRGVNENATGTGLLASGNNLGGIYLVAGSGVAGTGVFGVFGSGTAYGTYGTVNNATGMGGLAINSNATGTGLMAIGNNATGNYLNSGSGVAATGNDGVYGKSNSATGTGIIGSGNNSGSIIVNGNGGGVAGSGTRNGVYGYAGNGSRVNGNRGNAGGIFLLDTDNDVSNNNGTNNSGIRASAVIAGYENIAFNNGGGSSFPAEDSYFGGYFSGGTERIAAANLPTSYAYVGLRYDTNNQGTSGTDFKIVGPGSVSTIINDEQNVPRIMFAPEAPEIVFQDYGVGQLVNGQVYISLDPVLKKSLHIDSEHPLKVFVTLEGDCNGVYVTNKSANGFTVKELQNGTSNVPFSWQIVANRADTKDASGAVVSKHVGLRLPVGPGPLKVAANLLEEKEANADFETKMVKTDDNSYTAKVSNKSGSADSKDVAPTNTNPNENTNTITPNSLKKNN